MKRAKKLLSLFLASTMMLSTTAFVATAQAGAAETTAETTSASTVKSASDFSWDNASVYFLLTDRFYNGNTANDHAYGRSLSKDGKTVVKGNSNAAVFHGGDFAGITKKIEEGYFTDLGVNALWISAPYEQIHGYCMAGNGKSGSYPHYSYHGYYTLDYTETDANFGTAEEFEKMVDTAHKNGIRIVMDIVMNHSGYNTLLDMSEFGFGDLKPGWEDNYYNAKLTDQTYHQYIGYTTNTAAWAKWWGKDWLRAGLAGYQSGGGDDLTKELSFLPDFRTESSTTVDTPELLKTKWTKEGTLAAKTAAQNAYFSSTGKQKTVRNYLVYWLSQWVEKYGVDGFRCDTAKHVELASWKALKTECSSALQKWRQNNPNKPGADWDEDFWMTGEVFPHFLNYDSFYTQGGFDSLINFEFGNSTAGNAAGSGVPNASSINSKYQGYAQQINSNDKFNVLTYISSHDTWLARNCDLIYQGSAFQLMPGAIQIYYGDETSRPLYSDGSVNMGDHALRGDMNWSDLNNASSNQSKILAHWQKVGTFRNNHIAVGAGSHTSLSASSGAAFARTYNKNGVTDKIVACIGANKNASITITLNNTFADGTVLKNTYDGTTATVSGGKVTFNSGANGTILLEDSNSAEPTTVPTTVPPTVPTTAEPVETTAPTTVPTTVPATVPTTAPTTEPSTSQTQPSTEATEPTTGVPVGDKYLIGDVDFDGAIKVLDATVIQKALASIVTLSTSQLLAADCEPSGKVDIKDATIIQKYVAGVTLPDVKVGTYAGGSTNPTTPEPVETTAPTTAEPVETTAPTTAEPVETTAPTTAEPVTEPVTEEPTTEPVDDGNKIRFADTRNWGSVYAYFFTGSNTVGNEWPGSAMSLNGSYYEIDIPEGAENVVFSSGNGAQTTDLPLAGVYGYRPSGDSNGKVDCQPFSEGDDIGGSTGGSTGGVIFEEGIMRFTNGLNWNTVYAYFFNSNGTVGAEAPGSEMSYYEDNPFAQKNYQIAIPDGAEYVVFSDGNGQQTVDLPVSGVIGYWLDGTQTDGKYNGTAWDPIAMEQDKNN